MFSVDPEELQSVVNAAKAASDNINSASNLLSQISQHNDWQCLEKYAINESSIDNKKRALNIKERANSYYDCLSNACAEIKETENNIPSAWADLDSIISSIGTIFETINPSNKTTFPDISEIDWKGIIGTSPISIEPVVIGITPSEIIDKENHLKDVFGTGKQIFDEIGNM